MAAIGLDARLRAILQARYLLPKAYLGVSRSTLLRLADAGRLHSSRPTEGTVRFDRFRGRGTQARGEDVTRSGPGPYGVSSFSSIATASPVGVKRKRWPWEQVKVPRADSGFAIGTPMICDSPHPFVGQVIEMVLVVGASIERPS
jgi:hypothetical protein